MTEKELVEWHVLYNQNEIVSELVKASIIEDEAIYDTDVLEWWLITPTLANWLKDENEVVIEDLGCYWWGRTISGQAIYQDEVIFDICQAV